MKKTNLSISAILLLVMGIVITLNSCKKDDDDNTDVVVGGNDTLSGNITTSRTLTANKVWYLNGSVYVKDGAILTIEAGTLIKGIKESTRPALIVERGGKIMAVGTKEKPIVFTSNQAVGKRANGDWGGIIICGKAKINSTSGEAEIEGGVGVKYGGTDDADNSGKLVYVRIEYPGIPFEPNKEINGLTMGGVGSGTEIDYVQVSYSGDDSFEWFGGAVNCKHLVAYKGVDDDFDTDYGFTGMIQYGLVVRDPQLADAAGDSNGFESDNDDKGSTNVPNTKPTFVNISFFGPISADGVTYNSKFNCGARLRRNSRLNVFNSIFAGFPKGIRIEESASQAAATSGELKVNNCILAGNVKNHYAAYDSTYIANAANNIRAVGKMTDLKITDAYNSTTPNFLPMTGSPALTGAATGLNAFFKAETFVGGFGTEDWTAGWANFDPQNKTY